VKRTSIFIAFLFFFLNTFGNGGPASATSSIQGIVSEVGQTETLAGVKVSVKDSDVFTYTDKDGHFELSNIPTGKVELCFSLVSFEPKVFEVEAKPSQKTAIEVALVSR
jgi:hypothetical protein